MKQIVAFLIATAIFLAVLIVVNVPQQEEQNTSNTSKKESLKPLQTNNPLYRLKVDLQSRDRSYYAIAENLAKDTMPIFGSSELNHSVNKATHPSNLFKESEIDLMLIGKAYNQCLYFSTLAGAIENDMTNKKVVLILSYTWFRKPNVEVGQFSGNFSKTEYLKFMQNSNISKDNKKYVADRTEEELSYLGNDQYDFVKLVNSVYLQNKPSSDNVNKLKKQEEELKKKDYTDVKKTFQGLGIKINQQEPERKKSNPDWKKLETDALAAQKKLATNNKYGIDNDIWNSNAAAKMRQNSRDDEIFRTDSIEFKDFEYFLKICKDCKIKPMIMFQAINGKYFDDYDYEGEGKERRAKILDKVASITKKYNVKYVDFSKYNYTPYFLEDRTHPSQYGWEKYDEEIYKFYKES